MTLYRPLLKAKPGEWQAFGALPPAVAGGIRPVFEIGPDTDLVQAIANPTVNQNTAAERVTQLVEFMTAWPLSTLLASGSVQTGRLTLGAAG